MFVISYLQLQFYSFYWSSRTHKQCCTFWSLSPHCVFTVSINRCWFLDSILHISLSKQGAIGLGIAKAEGKRRQFSRLPLGVTITLSPEEKEKLETTGTTMAFLVTLTCLQNVQKREVLSELRGQNILMKSFHAVAIKAFPHCSLIPEYHRCATQHILS